MTHADLVGIAARWLKRCNCCVVLTERGVDEVPDAIGWVRPILRPTSYVVECKVSRADFLADRKKPWREDGRGLGKHRFYLAPKGVIRVEELPRGWGLLEPTTRGVYTIVGSPAFELTQESIERERSLLLSELAIYHANGIGYETFGGKPALPHLTLADVAHAQGVGPLDDLAVLAGESPIEDATITER